MSAPATSSASAPAKARRPKKIVICLDGTNDQIGVSPPTNVAKTYRMVSLLDPTTQIAYYDPGIGTLPAPNARGAIERHVSRGEELAFGIGIKEKMTEAYTWLMQHYEFGDEIYVFGFSRGAYTARALVGMLHCPGLLRPGSENLIAYAVSKYATNDWPDTPAERKGIAEFSDAFCWGTPQTPVNPAAGPSTDEHFYVPYHSVPIRYLGIWDTVEASGLAHIGEHHWRFTDSVPNAARVRHAVSINEWRNPYRQFLLADRPPSDDPEEAWFAGVHSDVGGTYEDDPRLALIALKWVVDGVVRDLILRESNSYSVLFDGLDESAYAGRVHPLGKGWLAAGPRHGREIPDNAWIHQTAVRRAGEQNLDPHFELPEPYRTAAAQWHDLIPNDQLAISPGAAQPF